MFGVSGRTGLIAMCFIGAFGFVAEDRVQQCRLREGFKRVSGDGQ
jgi:hypothetical protein